MSLIICVRIPKAKLPTEGWRATQRPCGMNSILFMDHRYPSTREKVRIKLSLSEHECAIVFNSNDRPVEIYHNYGVDC